MGLFPIWLLLPFDSDFQCGVVVKSRFTFIDLFAGIGGFRSAMTALGGRCVFTSEWDKFAVQTYKAWYKDDHVHTDDIRLIDPRSIPDHDVLCAGFPCQPFSIAGVSKKNALGRKHGFEDEKQGNLFFAIMDIVAAKKPPVLFLENVKNLKSHDRGNTWKVIESHLSKNYIVFTEIVDAKHWVPQHRERIFIICFRKDLFPSGVAFEFPRPLVNRLPEFGDIREKAPARKYMLTDNLWKYLKEYKEKHQSAGNGFGYGIVPADGISRTLSARYYKDGSEILVKEKGWKNPRRLTIPEAQRLMGFVDRYASLFGHEGGFPQVVSDTQAYRQFGNAVVPLAVEEVGRAILDFLPSVRGQDRAA